MELGVRLRFLMLIFVVFALYNGRPIIDHQFGEIFRFGTGAGVQKFSLDHWREVPVDLIDFALVVFALAQSAF